MLLLLLDCFLVSVMFSLVGQTSLSAALPPPLSDKVLHSWPGPELAFYRLGFLISKDNYISPGIHHVTPVLGGPSWQLLEPLDQQDTGVTDVTSPGFRQPEAPGEELLVLGAAGEPGAAGLGFTDTASFH